MHGVLEGRREGAVKDPAQRPLERAKIATIQLVALTQGQYECG